MLSISSLHCFDQKIRSYGAQTIVSRKVLKAFTELRHASSSIFTGEAVPHANDIYTACITIIQIAQRNYILLFMMNFR